MEAVQSNLFMAFKSSRSLEQMWFTWNISDTAGVIVCSESDNSELKAILKGNHGKFNRSTRPAYKITGAGTMGE